MAVRHFSSPTRLSVNSVSGTHHLSLGWCISGKRPLSSSSKLLFQARSPLLSAAKMNRQSLILPEVDRRESSTALMARPTSEVLREDLINDARGFMAGVCLPCEVRRVCVCMSICMPSSITRLNLPARNGHTLSTFTRAHHLVICRHTVSTLE